MTSYVQIAKFAICPTSSACEGAAAPSPSNPRLLSTEPRPSMSDTGTTSPVRHGTRIPRWNPARLPLVARAGKAAVRFRRLSSFCGRNMTGIRSASGARIWRSVSGARLQPLDEIKDLFRRTHVLHFRENRHERVGVCLRPRGLRLAAQLLRALPLHRERRRGDTDIRRAVGDIARGKVGVHDISGAFGGGPAAVLDNILLRIRAFGGAAVNNSDRR